MEVKAHGDLKEVRLVGVEVEVVRQPVMRALLHE